MRLTFSKLSQWHGTTHYSLKVFIEYYASGWFQGFFIVIVSANVSESYHWRTPFQDLSNGILSINLARIFVDFMMFKYFDREWKSLNAKRKIFHLNGFQLPFNPLIFFKKTFLRKSERFETHMLRVN